MKTLIEQRDEFLREERERLSPDKYIGKCYICHAEVLQKDLGNTVRYFEGWPGDHLACTKHPGVVEEYNRQFEQVCEKMQCYREQREMQHKLQCEKDVRTLAKEP